MKKSKLYNFDKEQETSSVSEPEVAYYSSLPFMSRKEALEHGMTLEESKRLLFERIRQDFNK